MDQKVIDKIRKLFALSESPSEAEAQSAYSKAHELLKAYNLSIADITVADEVSQASGINVAEGTHLPRWALSLLTVIARANYCAPLYFHTPPRGGQWSTQHFKVMVYGREHNVQSTMVMYEYLHLCIVRAERIARSEIALGYRRKDFQFAMVDRLSQRIQEAMVVDSGCTALVVLSTEARDAMRRAHPNTTTMPAVRTHINDSYLRGLDAANRVNLHQQLSSKGGFSAKLSD
jgi:hypothetical protein